MARDAYRFLLPLLLLAVLCLAEGFLWMAAAAGGLALFVAFFFRDPERQVPADPEGVVSPADGRVVGLRTTPEGTLLSIFLSILDVHIVRAPIGGVIVRQEYRKGSFRVAWDERASLQNEQLRITIRGPHELTFSLIAGLVARRILPWKKERESVRKGDRIGLIRFGSRVDLLLPAGCFPCVREGERVCGGSTLLARYGQPVSEPEMSPSPGKGIS